MQAIEQICAAAAECGVSARYGDSTFTFTLDPAGSRQLVWTVDETGLERLAALRRREARTVRGGGDGWALLLHLQEQLETFTGNHGVIVATAGGRLVTTSTSPNR